MDLSRWAEWLDPRWRPHWTYHYLEPLFVSWVIAFLLVARKPHWSWRQGVGLSLILYPLVDMAFGIYASIPTLIANPVLRPLSEYAMWWTFWDKMLLDLALPIVGLLVFHERVPFLEAPSEVVREGAPAMLDQAGVWRARGLLPDVLLGCALVIPIALAYGGASLLANLLFTGANTSNEVHYWQNLTPLLVLLLSLAAGVTEEFLFRGLMFRYLGARMGLLWAALVQAVLFGFVHAGYGNWAHVVGPALFGLAMAYVTLRLGIMAAVLLHVAVDIVAFGEQVLLRAPGDPFVWAMFLTLAGANVAAYVVFGLEPLRRLWPGSKQRARLPLEKEGGAEAPSPRVSQVL